MTSRIPPLLSPYIHVPPESSLTLVTGILGASANWLIIRYLYAALGESARPNHVYGSGSQDAEEGFGEDKVAVVLVSWMRDWEFWKTEARRAVGLDLARLQQQGRFVFVDGLTRLFVPSPFPPPSAIIPSPSSSTAAPGRTRPATLPLRPAVPSPSVPTDRSPRQPTPQSDNLGTPASSATPSAPSTIYLTDPSLPYTTKTILTALSAISTTQLQTGPRKILLILDQPNLLLRITPPPTNTTSASLSTALLHLRVACHATVVALPADDPFLRSAADFATDLGGRGSRMSGTTPLEEDNAAFLVGVVQGARCVVACRRLGTGWAGDVSGVVRVTRGGAVDDEEERDGLESERERKTELEEGEWLYHVGGDGGVRVWGRGSS